jgi:hypothetical protein
MVFLIIPYPPKRFVKVRCTFYLDKSVLFKGREEEQMKSWLIFNSCAIGGIICVALFLMELNQLLLII